MQQPPSVSGSRGAVLAGQWQRGSLLPEPSRACWPHTAGQHMSRAAFSCCDGSSSKSQSLQFITTFGRRFRVLRETCQRSWIVFQSRLRSRRGRRGGNLQAWHLTCCNTIPCTWHYFSPSLLKGHKLWTHRSSFFLCSCGKHKSCKAGAVTWPVPEVIWMLARQWTLGARWEEGGPKGWM